MSNVYWKEFKGWLQAFTNTEKALSLLFFVLLVVFLVLLVFVIVHLSICPEKLETEEFSSTTESTTGTISEATLDKATEGQEHSSPTTPWSVTPDNDTDVGTAVTDVTIGPGDTCTWGRRTSTATRYLEEAAGGTPGAGAGELARYTLALVQLRPAGATLGCTATAVAPRWALTAASCLHAIQEEDSLDGLVLRGAWRGAWGAGVAAVRVHPQYHGSVRARDAAALRAAAPLLPPGAAPVPRASLLDYLLVTIGERFTLLGYGKFRSVGAGAARRVLRATVYSVPLAQCAAPRGQARAREPRELPPLGAGALCAAPGGPRAACRHCAGAPLYRGRVLYGFMGHNPRCGVSCGPALFVNIAAIQHWLDELEAE